MVIRKTLTNEKLKKNYDNPFALVNHAIDMATRLIAREEDHEYNPANRVLDMIVKGQEVPVAPICEEEEEEHS